jgi:hypothetical protein
MGWAASAVMAVTATDQSAMEVSTVPNFANLERAAISGSSEYQSKFFLGNRINPEPY